MKGLNNMKPNHTKTPWKYTTSSKHGRPQISGQSGHQICLMWRDGEMDANTQFIIKAINSHDELIEALKLSEKFTKELAPNSKLYKIIQQALAKAGE